MKVLYAVLLLVVASAGAQDLRMGKVSVDELKETRHPKDSSAVAAILYKKGQVNVKPDQDGNWIAVTEVEVRIKIYKKEGYDFANFEKEFYSGGNPERISFHDEATYNLENGKVVKTKMKGESEFVEEKSKNWKSKKISLPNVKEGSIIEYRYILTSYGVSRFDPFFFQYPIPVNFISYRVQTPEYFKYNVTLGGYLRPVQEDNLVNNVDGSFNELRSTYMMHDVKAMKDESYVDNINNYRSRIMYELVAFKSPKYIENFATDWSTVAKNIYNNDDFGRQLEKDAYFEEELAPVIAASKNREQKISDVFNFVQSRMNWNEFVGYSCDAGVKAAYKNRTGNTAEINLMLVAMLRHAGIEANPVLVSTRSNGIALFPSRLALNYVVAGIESPMGVVLLDATSKNAQPGILPIRAINWVGRMIRNDGTSLEVSMVPKTNSRETITMLAEVDAEGKVSGKIRDQHSDNYAFTFREKYLGVSKESYLEKLEKRYTGLLVNEYKIENDRDLSKPVVETYDFTHESAAEIIGDKIYLSPMMFFSAKLNPFKEDTRDYPVDFVYPHQDKYSINIKIPDGYAIESIPSPVSLAMVENLGAFKYNISSTGNAIQLSVQFDMNTAVVSQTYYSSLKLFYKEMIAKQSEKIVLKKA